MQHVERGLYPTCTWFPVCHWTYRGPECRKSPATVQFFYITLLLSDSHSQLTCVSECGSTVKQETIGNANIHVPKLILKWIILDFAANMVDSLYHFKFEQISSPAALLKPQSVFI